MLLEMLVEAEVVTKTAYVLVLISTLPYVADYIPTANLLEYLA